MRCSGCGGENDSRFKTCDSCRSRGRAGYHSRTPEERRERSVQKYWSDPEKGRAKSRQYYEANRADVQARHHRWQKENRDRQRAYYSEYRRANRARYAEANRRRYAQLKAATIGEFTLEQLDQRLSMFAGCWLCGEEPETVDHVKPVSKGGPHILANFRPACQSCNSRKGSKWPLPGGLVSVSGSLDSDLSRDPSQEASACRA